MLKRVRIGLILAILLLLSALSVSALDIYPNPVKTTIYENESAEFNFSFYNNLMIPEQIEYAIPSGQWNPETVPAKHLTSGIVLRPKSDAFSYLYMKPRLGTKPGVYQVPIRIKVKDEGIAYDETFEIEIVEYVPPPESYEPDFDAEITVPRRVNPRNPFSIVLNLKNNNPLHIEELKIEIDSEHIHQKSSTELEPLKTKTVEFTVDLDDKEKPQKETVLVKIYLNETVMKYLKANYEITSSLHPFQTGESILSGFLRRAKRITLTNDGNAPKSSPVYVKTSFLKGPFSKTEPPTRMEIIDGERFFVWDVELDVDESTSVVVIYDYRIIFVLAIVLIIGLFSWFQLKSPITVNKHVSHIETKEGSLSEMKVVISVKNRRNISFEKVRVVEKLPDFVSYADDYIYDTLEPTSRFVYEKGTVLKWMLDSFDPKEERILSYVVRTRLDITGSVSLRPTIVEFEMPGTKKTLVILSNTLDVVSE